MDETGQAYCLTGGGDIGAEVVVHLASGNIDAFEYREWMRRYFNSEVGIIIEFPLHRMTIEGINLQDLFMALVSRSVSQLHERHTATEFLADDDVYISKIIIENFARP